MGRILLNIDAGELPDEPEELYALAHMVNVACGGHAGDDASMDRVIAACMQSGAKVAAHPSYEDRAGFGRKAIAMDPDAIERMVHDQCARLLARASRLGAEVQAMKPHGALYHTVDKDIAAARATVAGAARALGTGAAMVGSEKGQLARAARDAGMPVWSEKFADRGILPDGSLVPRGQPGALVTDPSVAAATAARIAIAASAETVCVHGDTPGSVAIARAVRRTLDAIGEVHPYGDEAWRWEIAKTADRRALLAALRAMPGATDAIVTEAHACVVGAAPDLTRLAHLPEDRLPGRLHTIRVRYDGVDLDLVAEAARLSREEVASVHGACVYDVAMIGFLPGFAYLEGLDPRLRIPRRSTPRPRVPAGAVGIAAHYTGIYPSASSGGWHLIGTALDFSPFDAERGATFALGDRVRFEPAP